MSSKQLEEFADILTKNGLETKAVSHLSTLLISLETESVTRHYNVESFSLLCFSIKSRAETLVCFCIKLGLTSFRLFEN